MAGSVIGHGISRAMFGGGGEQQQPQQYDQQYDQQQQYAQPAAGGAQPCQVELENFFTCLQQNNNDQQYCQAYLEQLSHCRQTVGQQ